MQVSFQPARFWAVLRLFWQMQPRFPYWLPVILPLLCSVQLMANVIRYPSWSVGGIISFFNTCVACSCIVYAGFLFRECRTKGGISAFVHLPATVREKYAAKMALGLIIFPAFAILASWGIFSAVQILILNTWAYRYTPIGLANVWEGLPALCCGVLSTAAIGLYWPRNGFFVFVALVLLYNVLGIWMFALMPNTVYKVPLAYLSTAKGVSPESYQLEWMYKLAAWLPYLVFGVSIYFQIKEKEVR
jgi:hypothetical protein